MILWVLVAAVMALGVVLSAWLTRKNGTETLNLAVTRSLFGVASIVVGVGAVVLYEVLFAPGPRDQYSTWFMFRTAFWPGWILLCSPLFVVGLSFSSVRLKESRTHILAVLLLSVLTVFSVQLSYWLHVRVAGLIGVQVAAILVFLATVMVLSLPKPKKEKSAQVKV